MPKGSQNHVKEAKKLTSKARNQISEGNFALSGRRYPIHDRSHAQNALSRVSQHGTGAEKQQVREAVMRKYPSMSKEAFFFGRKTPKVDPFPVQTMGGVDVVYGNPHDIASSGLGEVHEQALLDALESGNPDPDAYALQKVREHEAIRELEKKHQLKFTDIREGPSGPGTYRFTSDPAGFSKTADHVTERAMERTNLTKREVHELRRSIAKTPGLEKGKTYHVEIPDRGYVVVGDVGKRRKKHVAKTILSPQMRPPGQKLELDTHYIVSKGQTTKEKEEKLYRPRVDAIVHKKINGKPHVLVAKAEHLPHNSSRYSFPGGGIDPGQSAHQAAQMELREEAGITGKNFKSYGKQTKVDLDSDWQSRQFKKRGELWHGIDNQVVVGEYQGADSSLHGSQGDAWQFEWEDAKKVEKELRKDKSMYSSTNQIAADALRDLRVKQYGQKALYLSNLAKRRS